MTDQITNIKSEESTYKERISELQKMMVHSISKLENSKTCLIVVFEGLDASGKSGCIKRLTKELSPTQYSVVPISKPTEEEYKYHYLHRFWRKLPEYGKAAFFDRSWYGRVLVERVEELCLPDEWMRAYREINAFEKMLFDDGAIILKFWFEVSPAEQLKRFQKRLETPEKSFKITDEDWRNRSKRAEYEKAAQDMLKYTDFGYAPWTVIQADNKKAARIKTAEEIISKIDFIN